MVYDLDITTVDGTTSRRRMGIVGLQSAVRIKRSWQLKDDVEDVELIEREEEVEVRRFYYDDASRYYGTTTTTTTYTMNY